MAQGIDLLPAIIPGETVRKNPTPQDADSGTDREGRYVVIVYNDEWHTFEQVERQLMKATGCSLEKAEALSHEIDGKGRAVVFASDAPDCERVARVLREIKLQVETDRA